MALEIVHGDSRNRAIAMNLVEHLEEILQNGTVYLGYPVLATADERVSVDALAVTQEHGLIAFLFATNPLATDDDWQAPIDDQNQLFAVLESHLGRHSGLRSGRKLAAPVNTATLFPYEVPNDLSDDEGSFFGTVDTLGQWIRSLPPITANVERALQAALQRVTTIKPAKKRADVVKPTSRGATLKVIEREIANLDQWQKRAAIESPDAPQRIRGLAGSGKTVVLALKAAYWHTQHPEWDIVITFHSRALYQQIDNLITRFTFEHSNDKPDYERLRIGHSWGSSRRPGVYSMIADALGEPTRDWVYAQEKYGYDGAFQGVCQELLAVAKSHQIEPIFDAVLIDEAQDLPPEFFRLVYMFTKDPKRVVWGYDELQKLSESAMPSTDELFGTGESGESLVSLISSERGPSRDITLPTCYRNTPWALATAHALGIGVYREENLLQHPDEPSIWQEIGYEVESGALIAGSLVTLRREKDSYPAYFEELLKPEDAVVAKAFEDEKTQDAWVASEVKRNLEEDELDADDILIVIPDSYRAKSRGPRLMSALRKLGIECHLAGVTTSVDTILKAGSVAITQIHRAKGNEAPMVYAVDAQYAASHFNAVTRRNTLFTAITRSRAWVRVTGWGDAVQPIMKEIDAVVDNNFKLKFSIPTTDELRTMRHIHRERPSGEEASVRKATQNLSSFFGALERGEIDIHDLPPDLRTKLVRYKPDDDIE